MTQFLDSYLIHLVMSDSHLWVQSYAHSLLNLPTESCQDLLFIQDNQLPILPGKGPLSPQLGPAAWTHTDRGQSMGLIPTRPSPLADCSDLRTGQSPRGSGWGRGKVVGCGGGSQAFLFGGEGLG